MRCKKEKKGKKKVFQYSEMKIGRKCTEVIPEHDLESEVLVGYKCMTGVEVEINECFSM